jgi:hypothetical protein
MIFGSICPRCVDYCKLHVSLFVQCFVTENICSVAGSMQVNICSYESKLQLKNCGCSILLEALCKTIICSNHPEMLLQNSTDNICSVPCSMQGKKCSYRFKLQLKNSKCSVLPQPVCKTMISSNHPDMLSENSEHFG